MRIPSLIALLGLVVALTSGCQTGTVSAVVPIAGGGKINVPMTKNGPPPGEAEGYRSEIAALIPGAGEREAVYDVGIVALNEPALKRIVVEDISDETPFLLVDDQNPQFENRHWRTKSRVFSADHPHLKWVFHVTVSMRVTRFTLTALDGHEFSFNHVTVYPPFIKGAMRAKWGEKY